MLLNQEPSFVFSTSFFFVFSLQNDRMAVDMAFELRKTNVACVSLWPGAVMTENIHDIIHSQSKNEMVKKKRKFYVIPYLYYPNSCQNHITYDFVAGIVSLAFGGMKWTVWLKRTLPAEMNQ